MLGSYSNFPENVHHTTTFASSISEKKLKKSLVTILQRLNSSDFGIETANIPSVCKSRVIFEFGVAEESDFNYLDSGQKDRLLKALEKKTVTTVDFLWIIRYYEIHKEKEKPLKFDYYILRFKFNETFMEMQIFHEKGPMHVSPEDLPEFIADKVNAEFSRKVLRIIAIP